MVNHKSNIFWETYWEDKSEKAPANTFVSAWAFGADPDHLLDLVQQGKKTATCSGHIFYEKEQEPLRKLGNMRSFWTARMNLKPSSRLCM